MTLSDPQDSEVVSAVQTYDRPVVGSSYSWMVVVPNAHRKYWESQTPGVVGIERLCLVLQLLS